MRITKIEGYTWPITFTCPNFPEVNIELSLPSDMNIRREYSQQLVEDTPVLIVSKETVVFNCPICGNLHEIATEKVPPIIRNRITILK